MKKTILQTCLRLAVEDNNPAGHPLYNIRNYIHFSFIVQNNMILSMGTNRDSAPLIKWYKNPRWKNRHSEVDAYLKAYRRIHDRKPFEVVNVRLSKSSEPRISAPCVSCQEFLYGEGCSWCYYTTSDKHKVFEKIKLSREIAT